MMNTCDIREYFDNILLGNPEEIIDNLSIIEDYFFYVVNFTNENNEDYIYSIDKSLIFNLWGLLGHHVRVYLNNEEHNYKFAYRISHKKYKKILQEIKERKEQE